MTDPRLPKIACVLLAAGGSTRLGEPKQLLRHRGSPLLIRAIGAGEKALGRPVVVVLGARALRLRSVLERRGVRARPVVNARWREGLSSSLAVGLRALPPRTAALLMLVDQPNVDSAALERLVAAWRKRPAAPAAALYGGRAGVPAILPPRHFAAAYALTGDQGARALLRSLPDVTLVPMPEAEADVDTPQDVRTVLR